MAFQLSNIEKQSDKSSGSLTIDELLKKDISFLKNPFTNKFKEDFYTELSVLLKAGVPLKDALELIINSIKKQSVTKVLNQMLSEIISGQSLSDILGENKHFSPYEFHSIKIGEETGSLELVTEQLGAYFARKNQQRREVVSALTYPAIICCTAVLAVIFMLSFVVPMFEDIFKQQGVELPSITRFIISCSGFLSSNGTFIALTLLGLIVTYSVIKHKKWFKKASHYFILKIPFVGVFTRTVYLSQFTQAIALLTASKVSLAYSIGLVKQMINFYPLQEALNTIENDILLGKTLSQSLSQHAIFEPKMIALVKVAEQTNQTEFVFKRLNTQYNTKVQQLSKSLSSIVEPLIIIIVGGFVGLILIAMYLPMFKLSTVLG